MKCLDCGADPSDGKTRLIRQNEFGIRGIWRCEKHNEMPIPEEVQRIFDALDGKVQKEKPA